MAHAVLVWLALLPGVFGWSPAPGETLQVTISAAVRGESTAAGVAGASPAAGESRITGGAVAPNPGGPHSRPPVVLIPGLFGSAFGYRKLVPLLNRAGHETIVIEPLGVGASTRPEVADYSLTAQADRIARVLERQGVPPALVVAHGVGASMALRMAYRHPGRVLGIISIDGGPAETAASPGLSSAMKFAPFLKALAGERVVRGRLRHQIQDASGDPSWLTEEVLEGYTAPLNRDFGEVAAAFRAMAASVEAESLAPNLPRIRQPVEILLGGAPHDYALPLEEMTRLRAALPDLVTLSVPGAGHYVHEEQPEAVMTAVHRVMRRLRPPE